VRPETSSATWYNHTSFTSHIHRRRNEPLNTPRTHLRPVFVAPSQPLNLRNPLLAIPNPWWCCYNKLVFCPKGLLSLVHVQPDTTRFAPQTELDPTPRPRVGSDSST
jgi:hypothetical protein